MLARRKRSRSRVKLEIKRVQGWLRWESHEIRTTWSVRITDEGYIAISFSAVKLQKDTVWMLDILGGNELFGSWAEVSGTSAEGVTVTSKHVHLGSRNERSGRRGTFISLGGEATRLRI